MLEPFSLARAVFLAALVGMAAEEKARVVEHLGKHMAPGAALVVRSAHGARGFLYPVVDPEEIRRGGFDVLAVHHPEGEVINSVIIARKPVPVVDAHAVAGRERRRGEEGEGCGAWAKSSFRRELNGGWMENRTECQFGNESRS